MSLEETTPSADSGESLETLIANFNADPAEADSSAEVTASTPGTQAEQTPEVSAPAQPDPKEEEIELLRRVIAADPAKRHEYEMAKYGQTSLPQAPQQPQPPQAPPQQVQEQPVAQSYELPFAPEEYDPTSFEHQQHLLGHLVAPMIQQALAPALEYIQELKQQDAQEQQQGFHQQVDTMESELHKMMDQHVPGFSEMYGSEKHTPEQETVANFAYNKFTETLKQLYPPTVKNQFGQAVNPLWGNPKVQAEVIGKIGPQINQIASRLGIAPTAKPKALDPTIAKEAYVEGSNAVPAVNQNAFEVAAEKGDLIGMLSNFR